MRRTLSLFVPATALTLGACAVAPPPGPSVMALPGQNRSFEAFQQDDMACRHTPHSRPVASHPPPRQPRAGSECRVGTALGAAAGAAIGSVGGAVGAGAAIGAATGLIAGSAIGANTAAAS